MTAWRSIITCSIVVMALALSSCSKPVVSSNVLRSWQCMGTIAELTMPGTAGTQVNDYLDICEKITEELEGRLSKYRPGSKLSAISRRAGEKGVRLSGETLKVLQMGVQYAEISRGVFDPTVGPLTKTWGFGGSNEPEGIPVAEEIKTAKNLVDYRKITIRWLENNRNHTNRAAVVSLDQKGMELDLGGIAKGYAVDRCYEELQARDAGNFIVGIGGNLRCAGKRQENEPWRIGVRNPFVPEAILGRIRLSNGAAVATSGNYERFVEIAGRKYAHILDPRTGAPVQGMAQVTVISDSAADADALSTILFIMGVKPGTGILERTGGEALFVTDSKPAQFFATRGFLKLFEPDPQIAGRIRVVNETPLK
ncbi:MAG: FAD:protein FMN transferase [Verrucomicrobiota bacterium]